MSANWLNVNGRILPPKLIFRLNFEIFSSKLPVQKVEVLPTYFHFSSVAQEVALSCFLCVVSLFVSEHNSIFSICTCDQKSNSKVPHKTGLVSAVW